MKTRPVLLLGFCAYCLAAVLLSVWQIGALQWPHAPAECVRLSRQEAASDSDISAFLLPGLASKTSLPQTLIWWHGTWAGQVPFWRPLTSYAFWAEYRVFSPDRFDRWFWVSAASHLAFTLALFLFARRLTRRPMVAALAALVFAGASPFSPIAWAGTTSLASRLPLLGFDLYPPALVALDSWKNQPEAWAGALTLAAMTCALSRRWAWCLALAGLSIGVKESGWLTFPLVGLALWADGGLSTVPRPALRAGVGLALALLGLRAASGWAVFYGYHFGSNVYWGMRYADACLGPYLILFLRSAAVPGALLGTALFLLTRAARRPLLVRFALALCAVLILAAISALQQGQGLVVALTGLLTWGTGLEFVALALLWLLGAAALWEDAPRRTVVSLALMGLAAALPLAAAAQVQAHVLYLSYAFDSVLLALAMAALGRRMGRVAAAVSPGEEAPQPLPP